MARIPLLRGRAAAPSLPALRYQSDLIGRSVRSLGPRWTLLLLRDLAFLRVTRFGDFLRNNPGLTPRVLSRRLKEMQQDGLIVRQSAGAEVRYRLTPRGNDAVMILLAFLRYGLKHLETPKSGEERASSAGDSRAAASSLRLDLPVRSGASREGRVSGTPVRWLE